MHQKAFLKLLGLEYTIIYRKGMDNATADAISRSPAPVELSALSFDTPKWLDVVTEGYQQYDADKELLQDWP